MEKNNAKLLINELLQKLLDRRLNKLEKRNKEEECTLKAINKESQKSILALEECSHKCRKQIYLIRNKYVDERRNHNRIKNDISKTIELNKSNHNNMNNINTNMFSNIGNDNNLKKPEIYHHEKEEKLKNKKKRHTTISPKAVKNLLLEEKMKMIQKSIKDLKSKFKSTKNLKKYHNKNFLTVEITPKKKAKNKNIYTNPKKKVSRKSPGVIIGKTLTNFHVNTQKNENKKESRNNDDLHELSLNVIEKEGDVRLTELKIDLDKNNDESIINKKPSIIKPDEDIKKSPIREQKSSNEESLLINNLMSLNNEINDIIKNNPNDNININTDIKDNNNNDKEKNTSVIKNEEKNNTNNDNNENNKNEELNKNNDKNVIKNDDKNNIDNIILSNNNKNNLDYLIGDGSINFTLLDQVIKPEENDDNNKTIDLNISGLSDQLTLEEKFQTHLDDIIIYLDNKDICNLLLINKECFKTIMNFLISKTEIKIDIFEEEISKLIEDNKNILNIDVNNIKNKTFEFNANSSRAISLLNTVSMNNFIKIKTEYLNNKEIIIIFDILFIAQGKLEIIAMDNNEKKWEYIFNYFKDYISNQSMGSFIEKNLNKKIFDNNIINSLYKYANKYLNIISPNHFQKINKDIAILIFILKDLLEHLGMMTDQVNPEKEIFLINSRLQSNKETLEKLNEMNNKIN